MLQPDVNIPPLNGIPIFYFDYGFCSIMYLNNLLFLSMDRDWAFVYIERINDLIQEMSRYKSIRI